MDTFTISPLADPSSCFCGWPSTAQHVARNNCGTFYVVATRAGNIATGSPNDFAIYREDAGGALSLFWSARSLPTNMISIDTFTTGELFAAWCDYTSGINHVAVFASPGISAIPVISSMTGAGCVSGKIAFIANEADRCLYFFGDAGWLFRINELGVEIGRQQVYAAVTDQPNYITMSFDQDQLYVGLCNAITGAAPSYDSIQFVMTPNASDVGTAGGAVFFSGPWPQTASLHLPFDPGFNGPGAWATLGSQYRNNNNLLLCSTVNGGVIHMAIAQAPNAGRRFFDTDNLSHLSVEAASMNFNAQPMRPGAFIHRPLRDGEIFPRACSGGITIRGSAVFLVLCDRLSLIAMRSEDCGKNWRCIAQTMVPMLGTDTIHYVSLMPGLTTDTDLIGMFNVLHCTPSQWANGSAPVPPAYAANNPTATAFRFALPVAAALA